MIDFSYLLPGSLLWYVAPCESSASHPDDKGRRVERVAVPVGRARVVVRHLEVAIRPSRLGGPTGVGNQTVKVLFKMGELN